MFAHKKNLISKIDSNYKNKKDEIVNFYDTIYNDLFNQLMSMSFDTENEEVFILAAKLINEYLMELDEFSKKNGISSQSKFRSTFLEEISEYLFSKLQPIVDGTLNFYNKNIYAGLKFGNGMKVSVLHKDVDFCIGKKVKLSIEGIEEEIIMPIVAVEVKTYLDATMFGEVQYSARLIKNAVPNVKTYVLMEYNQVISDKIIAARYDNALNEIFSLRKNSNSDVEAFVLKEYYIEISNAINNINYGEEVITPGRLLHRINEED